MICTVGEVLNFNWLLVPLKKTSCEAVRVPSSALVTIGRGRACTVSCPSDLRVSKMHCTLVESIDGKCVEVQDFSSNGTRLNGRPLRNGERHRASHGDVLSLSWPSGGPIGEIDDGFTQFRLERKGLKHVRQEEPPSAHMASEAEHLQAVPAAKRLRTPQMPLLPLPSPCRSVRMLLRTGSDSSTEILNMREEEEEYQIPSPNEEGETIDVTDKLPLEDQAQNGFRSQVRKMFSQALTSGSNVAHSMARVTQSSAELEVALFQCYGGTADARYRQHARMLKTNLSAVGNGALRAKVISGEFSSENLILMSSAELAPGMLQKQRQEIIRSSMRESVLPSNRGIIEAVRLEKMEHSPAIISRVK